MRLILGTLAFFVFALVGCHTAAIAEPPQNTDTIDKQVQVAQLLSSVQLALARVQKDLAFEKMPLLKSVTLYLNAEINKDASGKVNLFVVSFGSKKAKSETQEIEITLTPPPVEHPLNVSSISPAIIDRLVAAILGAARGVQDAENNKDVPLIFSGLKVVLGFVVKKGASGGAQFEIVPVGFELSGNVSAVSLQKITIQYQNPSSKMQ